MLESPYSDYLAFIDQAFPLSKKNPARLIIFCSHPYCFTYGRGLQRDSTDQLVEFDLGAASKLPYPFFEIKRGGGLTYHYPGQIIIYPLFEVTRYKTSLQKVMIRMLQATQKSLEQMSDLRNLSYKNKLLGLWLDNQYKIASIGMNLEHFVTSHGLALNFFDDQEFFKTIKMMNPCGINGEVYQSFERLVSQKLSLASRQDFLEKFLNNLKFS